MINKINKFLELYSILFIFCLQASEPQNEFKRSLLINESPAPRTDLKKEKCCNPIKELWNQGDRGKVTICAGFLLIGGIVVYVTCHDRIFGGATTNSTSSTFPDPALNKPTYHNPSHNAQRDQSTKYQRSLRIIKTWNRRKK